MTEILLGNLTVEDLEDQLKIKFSADDRALLKDTWQQQVSSGTDDFVMPVRSWHFFDIPRKMVFGSFKFFKEFEGLISKYKLSGTLQISYHLADEEKVENIYELVSEDGFPMYLYGRREGKDDNSSWFNFFRLVKVNKKTLVYRQVKTKEFNRDILGITQYVSHGRLVPPLSATDDYYSEIKVDKDVALNPRVGKVGIVVVTSPFRYIYLLSPWKGEYISERESYLKDGDYDEANKLLKKFRKYTKELKDKLQRSEWR